MIQRTEPLEATMPAREVPIESRWWKFRLWHGTSGAWFAAQPSYIDEPLFRIEGARGESVSSSGFAHLSGGRALSMLQLAIAKAEARP